MCGFVVPSSYIYWLAVYTTFMVYCVTAIFLYEFLLEQTNQHSCNPSQTACYKYKLTSMVQLRLQDVHVFGICTFIIKVLSACFLFLKRCDAHRHKTLQYPILLLRLFYFSTSFLGTVINFFSTVTIYLISTKPIITQLFFRALDISFGIMSFDF